MCSAVRSNYISINVSVRMETAQTWSTFRRPNRFIANGIEFFRMVSVCLHASIEQQIDRWILCSGRNPLNVWLSFSVSPWDHSIWLRLGLLLCFHPSLTWPAPKKRTALSDQLVVPPLTCRGSWIGEPGASSDDFLLFDFVLTLGSFFSHCEMSTVTLST